MAQCVDYGAVFPIISLYLQIEEGIQDAAKLQDSIVLGGVAISQKTI